VRNLAAMSIEEMLRANPIDAFVLLGARQDHPGVAHGAAFVDLPAVVIRAGRC